MPKKAPAENTLELINKSVLRFLSPLAPEEVYKTIVEEAMKLVEAEYGSIFLLEKGKLNRVYASLELLYNIRPKKGGLIYDALSTQKPSVVKVKDFKEMNVKIKKMGTQSIVVIPLSYKNESIGVLTVESTKEERFTGRELDILRVFGSAASLAIKKSQLYKETRDALENRDLFISLAAHELRTPLTTMNVYIDILKKKTKASDKSFHRIADELSTESTRLGKLINELLSLTQVKSGNMTFVFKSHGLLKLINRAVTNFKFNHPKRKVVLEDNTKKEEEFLVDGDKLVQVITNLLDNAAKFSENYKEIKLSIKETKNEYKIKITDQGKGIPKEDLNKVFEGFYKGKDNHKQGLGLGLFLSKNIIDKHNGRLNLTSSVAKGTTAEIVLRKVSS